MLISFKLNEENLIFYLGGGVTPYEKFPLKYKIHAFNINSLE